MTAQINIDDPINLPHTGSVDRDNTFLGTVFTLSNFDNAGVAAWSWELIDKPIGSSAVLSATNTATCTVTPDIAGTYLVRLTTYRDGAASLLDGADEQGIGIRFATPFDQRIPAAGETTQFDATRGWATAVEESLRDTQAFMNSGVAVLVGAANALLTGADPETIVGAFVLAGGALPASSLKLRLVGRLTVAGAGTGVLRLYDRGPVGGPAIVGVLRATATIPNGSAGDIVVIDTPLTPAASPGVNLGQIALTRRVYELRAQLVGGAGGDTHRVYEGGVTFEG